MKKPEFNTTKYFRDQYLKEIGETPLPENGLTLDFEQVSPELIYKIYETMQAQGWLSEDAPAIGSAFYWQLKELIGK